MNNELDPLESIQEIRSYMRKSSQFVSLSGWSGIWVGTCGLISGFIAIYFLNELYVPSSFYLYNEILTLAIITFFVAVLGGIYFSVRKAKREGVKFINYVFKRMFINFSIPLLSGGFVCLALIMHNCSILLPSMSLIFYGLSLFLVSRDTLDEVRKLGFLEITLGVLSIFFIHYSLLFWIIGFGLLHIIYGIIMWNKYDKK